ncbi:hypothetical protein MSG28_011191 [Choristoneura fumiferana]|uniref:Uncharacterized protein n=1 Tax=Choristoneura fumiferana TaxID=7141 RepID=A0ACC0KQT5_CHOFU|nr:hypothetical protein MSG28_011191 [Choristoneura fumiferana]
MRAALLLLALGLAVVAAAPRNPQRIVGGEVTSIEQYPYGAACMYSWNLLTYHQSCGGAILNARAILSAAHCFIGDTPPRWRVRVGSTLANSGGVVHSLSDIFNHPEYSGSTYDNDIAILHLATVITFNNQAQPASIAAPSYNLPDNDSVWAIGWGTTSPGGVQSEQLRHVEVWVVNQAVCRARYAELGLTITNQMLCSGWLDVGGRDQCQGDSGGPLFHNNIIVGVCSWGQSSLPEKQQRIVGGSVTTIEQWPSGSALLYSWNLVTYSQACGGAILNTRSILSAAHCFIGDAANRWRIRTGSTWANSGGVVHNTALIIIHPSYNTRTLDNDIAILRSATTIAHNNQARPASIAGANYNLADNQAVWAIGWGATCPGCAGSEQLRHVQIWTVNQNTCRSRYLEVGGAITDNMLCSGWLDVGGRDQCQGDSGGPLFHNNVVVGVCSWGQSCALARYPGVNARVSRFTAWIQANA